MKALADKGLVEKWLGESDDPLGFLVHEGGASSLTEAAYRFARHEPGVDVVLFGTGDAGHLRANVAALLKPPLPEADRAKLAELFGHLTGIGLDFHQGPGAKRIAASPLETAIRRLNVSIGRDQRSRCSAPCNPVGALRTPSPRRARRAPRAS